MSLPSPARGVVFCSLLLAAWIPSSLEFASAGETSIDLSSDPGDYIGAGQQLSFQQTDGTFSAERNFDASVSVRFQSADHWCSHRRRSSMAIGKDYSTSGARSDHGGPRCSPAP